MLETNVNQPSAICMIFLSILYVAIINFFTLIFATSKNNKEYIVKSGCIDVLQLF